MTTFAVITPTIGSDNLTKCVESLRNQNCIHHVVVDGSQYWERVEELLHNYRSPNLHISYLDENVGKAGGDWYGHRIYAAASYLTNQDVLCYMDEDNWAGPYYIEAFENTLSKYQWAYTLRNINTREGEFFCQDNCESLGKWPVYGQGETYHIDTSCFAIPRQYAVQIGHAWYGQYAADRQFFANLKRMFPDFGCTRKHTVEYRLGGNEKSVTQEFFERGNNLVHEMYGDKEYPWHEAPRKLIIKTD